MRAVAVGGPMPKGQDAGPWTGLGLGLDCGSGGSVRLTVWSDSRERLSRSALCLESVDERTVTLSSAVR
eukprot:1216597-Prymnesium_polylepis.1